MSTTSNTIAAAPTAGGVKGWSKAVREIPSQTAATATDIGWVRNNDSRLNVVSQMTANDKVQWFKFKALSDGKFGLGEQSDKKIRIQVYDQHNRLIGDSKANQGAASTGYTNMLHSNYGIKTGNYTIKVTRDASVDQSAVVRYAMQMKIGSKYVNDYVTTQVALTQTQLAASLVSPTTQSDPTTNIISSALSMQSSLLGGTDMSGGKAGFFGILSTKA